MTTERARGVGGGPAPQLLAVSFAYPPLAYPRSMQVARLLKYARASTALVCADEEGARRDPTIEPEADALLAACLRVPFRETAGRRLASRLAYRLSRPLWTRLNMAPDKYAAAWRAAAVGAARGLLSGGGFRPAALVTFAQPFTDHLVGLDLKRRYGLPWVAHFSDPWTDNPFSAYDGKTRELNLALERAVVGEADRTVFTSRETVELVFAKYPDELRRKARVLPQCFDPDLYGAAAPEAADKLVVRYVGNFYGSRSPAPLFRALEALLDEKPRALDDVRFEIIGDHDPQLVSRAGGDRLPPGLLERRPPVPYRESLRLMAAADGLLIIDAPADVSVFLPSKLIDYLGAGRPILGLTPPGAARALIEALGGPVAHPSETAAAKVAVEEFLGRLRAERAGGRREWGAPEVRRRYEAAAVAGEFDEIIEEIAGGNK